MSQADTDLLLNRAASGDEAARSELLQRHRPRLRQMIACRMDPRLAARIDPSDVIQEAVTEAYRKLDGYLRSRPVPFYPWLRQIAWEKLVQQYRRHVRARRRSVDLEFGRAISNASVTHLIRGLIDRGSSPSAGMIRAELRQRVRVALEGLSDTDREILVLLYLERLRPAEAASVLQVSAATVYMRHLRALRRFRTLVGDEFLDGKDDD